MKPRFFPTPASFRAWLEKNHAKESELLVGFHKKGTGRPSITWPQSVDEALCFGWIDGVRRRLDEFAYSIRFTPRKRTSTWSAINVARVKELHAVGRMAPAGLAAFAARTEAKTGIYSYERREIAKLTATHEERLRANAKASAFLDAQPPWYRRTAIYWVVSAKKEETRDKRFAQLMADSAAGRTIPPLTPRTGKEDAKTKAPSRRRAPRPRKA